MDVFDKLEEYERQDRSNPWQYRKRLRAEARHKRGWYVVPEGEESVNQSLEIDNCSIDLFHLPERIKAKQFRRYPAPMSLLTVGELAQMLARIQLNPFKTKHVFKFTQGRFLAVVHKNLPTDSEDSGEA